MNIRNISVVCFSPTGSSRALAEVIAGEFPAAVQIIDITPYAARSCSMNFSPDDLVIFSVPVYGGRVPAPAAETIAQMHGNHTPVILTAVYGNRDYDDALLELRDTVVANGFIPCAAAALIAEHNIMHSVGSGRPDDSDLMQVRRFSKQVQEKLSATSDAQQLHPFSIKGNHPYRSFGGFPLKPAASSACVKCGTCVPLCPVGAIPRNAPDTTQTEICISCMRCIKICPQHARALDQAFLAEKEKGFYEKCSARREPEFYL